MLVSHSIIVLARFFFQNYLSKTLGISCPKLSSPIWLLRHPKFRVTVRSSVNYELNITVFQVILVKDYSLHEYPREGHYSWRSEGFNLGTAIASEV